MSDAMGICCRLSQRLSRRLLQQRRGVSSTHACLPPAPAGLPLGTWPGLTPPPPPLCSTTVFSHSQTVVMCPSCNTVLCVPTGGKARLTEGCSFRRKGD